MTERILEKTEQIELSQGAAVHLHGTATERTTSPARKPSDVWPTGAKEFLAYLGQHPHGPVRVERLKDTRESLLVHFRTRMAGTDLPIAVIFDMTGFLVLRMNLSPLFGGNEYVCDAFAAEVMPHLMRATAESRLVRYYLTPNMLVIADICLPPFAAPAPHELIDLLALLEADIRRHAQVFAEMRGA